MVLLSLLTLLHEFLAGAVGADVHPMTALYMALWDGFRTMYGRGSRIKVISPAAQLSSCGRGFLSRMMLCTYFAALIAQLITSNRLDLDVQVSSMDDVVSGGYTLCLEESMRTSIELLYPNLSRIVEVDRAELLTGVRDGKCSFALAQLQDLQDYQSRGALCDITRRGSPILDLQMALAVSPRTSQALRYQIAVMSATWHSLLASNTPASTCVAATEEDSEFGDVFGRRRMQEWASQHEVRRLLAESTSGPIATLVLGAGGFSGASLEMKYMVGPLVVALVCVLLGVPVAIAGCLCSPAGSSRSSDKALSSAGSDASSEAQVRLSSGGTPASAKMMSERRSTQKADGGLDTTAMLSVLRSHHDDLKAKVEELSVAIHNVRWTRSSKSKEKGPSTKVLMQDVLKEVHHANTRLKAGSRQEERRSRLNYGSLGMLIG